MPQPRSMPFWKQARLSFISSDQDPDALREWEPLTGKDDDDVASSVEGDTPATLATAYGDTSSSCSTPSRSASSKKLIGEPVRGSGLAGLRLDKEELRRRVLIPYRLLAAVVEAVRTSDIGASEEALEVGWGEDAPESPLVVFVNSRSGGRYGPVLKDRLQDLIGRDQVRAPALHIFLLHLWFLTSSERFQTLSFLEFMLNDGGIGLISQNNLSLITFKTRT